MLASSCRWVFASSLIPEPFRTFCSDFHVKADATVGDVANMLVVIVAGAALCVAWYQLRGLALQTRATTLMALDERWERAEMLDVRRALWEFIEEMEGQATVLPDPHRFARELSRLSNCAAGTLERAKYDQLFLRILGYFEALGYAVQARYIKLSDVHALLEGPIAQAGDVFRGHIAERQAALNSNSFYSYFLWLADRITERQAFERMLEY